MFMLRAFLRNAYKVLYILLKYQTLLSDLDL